MDQPESTPEPIPEPTTESVLFFRLREHLPQLEELLKRVNDEWVYEDLVYRFYHASFKVYRIQGYTEEIVKALQALAPDIQLNAWFLEIYRSGTGHTFDMSHNRDWLLRGRPMVEAFFHAKFMLEMAVRHGKKLKRSKSPPRLLDSGWAAFLYLYDLR
jgi:hypothetical protein